MKEDNFLDDLFDKARNQKPKFNPEIPLAMVGSKGSKANLWKTATIICAGIVALFAGIFLMNDLVGPNEKPMSNLQTSDSISDSSSKKDTPSREYMQSDTMPADSLPNPYIRLDRLESGFEVQAARKPQKESPEIELLMADFKPNLRGSLDQLQQLQGLPTSTYTLNAFRDTTIETPSGNRFYFEGQGFTNKLGQVVEGNVQVSVKECEKLSDYIREDLSTQSSDGLLETAGMFHLLVTQGKDTLSVRPGYDVGIGFDRSIPDRMNLYYGKRNDNSDIQWDEDPTGRTPAPIIVVTSGIYEKVTDQYFYKNYRFNKLDMLALLDSSWHNHFTLDNRKVVGTRSCKEEQGPFYTACQTFNKLLVPELATMDMFNLNSRYTKFGFTCLSKNKYAYAMSKGYIDSAVNYIPSSDFNTLTMPLFFSVSLGWINIDCVPEITMKWKKLNRVKKIDQIVEIPHGIQMNGYLYIPSQNAIARCRNIESGRLEFKQVPEGESAYLIITSYVFESRNVTERFMVYSSPVTTDGQTMKIDKWEVFLSLDDYLEWLEKVSGEIEIPGVAR